MVNQMSSIEKGARHYARVEFGNLSSYVALDAGLGTGLEYKDFSSSLRVFYHWQLATHVGLSLGGGAGLSYKFSGDNILGALVDDRKFIDSLVYPFARVMVDTGQNFGITIDAAYQLVPSRSNRYGTASRRKPSRPSKK